MRDIAILQKFGTLDPIKLAAIFLPPGTCGACGKVHWPGGKRNYRLTSRGEAIADHEKRAQR